MRTKLLPCVALAVAGLLASANAAIITVNTVNNTDFSAGVTNLWLAIQMANTNGQSANTINFNIPGTGPHYIVTPQFYVPDGINPALGGGYPIITNHHLTIDGYSQPGAMANTNTILGSNTAVLKIVIDSRQANYTSDPTHLLLVGAETMNYALITGRPYGTTEWGWPGFGPGEAAQIGIFNATNISIKGLCFLNDWYPDNSQLNVYSIALGADYPTNYPPVSCFSDQACHFYPAFNLHVSGCWFNLMPDGVTVVDGGTASVAARRHKENSSGNSYVNGRWSPSYVTFGVAKNSANPRAEFNIVMSQGAGIIPEGEHTRVCGNFFNVFPDGMHQYFPDPQRTVSEGNSPYFVPTQAFITQVYGGYSVIGTDGDGVNDAEERNIFAGLPRKRARGVAQINHQCGCYHIKIAGNYFGVAVDGVTRWTNSSTAIRYSNRPDVPTNCVFGTEFDGVSDDIEANVICNNWPLDYWFQHPDTEPNVTIDFFGYVAFEQDGAVPETVDSDKIGNEPGSYFCTSFRGNKLINNFTAPESPFYTWRDSANAPGYFPTYTNDIVPFPFSYDIGFTTEGATNFLAVLDTNSTTARLKGTFQLGIDPCTNVIIDVYVANEEGLTNGAKFQTLTNVLPVWAQGESVLAYNLQADGPGDLDAAPGAFEFDISPYGIPTGTKVTATASYALAGEVGTYMAEMHTSRFSLPVSLLPGPTPITITSIVNNGNDTVTLTWTGGSAPYVVEERASLSSGSWSPIQTNAAATATVTMGGQAFFRVK